MVDLFTLPQFEEIRRIVRQASGGDSTTPLSVTAVHHGSINEVYRISSPDCVYYLKRTPADGAPKLSACPEDFQVLLNADRLRFEASILDYLSNVVRDDAVPRVVHYSGADRMMLMTDVGGPEGRNLQDVFLERVNESITRGLADLLVSLAAGTWGALATSRGVTLDSRVRQLKLKYYYSDACRSLSLDRQQMIAIDRFATASADRRVILCHGDCHIANVVIRRDDTVALVDFEEAVVHDITCDIGVLLASYILMALAFPGHRDRILRLAGYLLNRFSLGVFEHGLTYQDRDVNQYVAGWMLFKIYGFSPIQLHWDTSASEQLRRVAFSFITDSRSTIELIEAIMAT